ncbi:MAG: Arylsulfotransferase [Solirubrobacteraceae bacterium]|nr:Arylsulfotransferase [Solirubrobacteraceae bacterium]
MLSARPRHIAAALGSALVLGAAALAVSQLTAADPPRAARQPPAAVLVSTGRLTCRLRHPRFHTLPDLKPTGLCMALRRGGSRTADDLLVTPRPDPAKNPGEQFGLMAVAPDGKLLWYMRRPTKVHDLKVVSYRGRPMLAFFQQDGDHGYYQLLDDRYRPVTRITAGHGYSTNLHDLQIAPDGSAWISADVPVHSHGRVIVEFVVQRVDVATHRVLFEWHSLTHVAPATSYEQRPGKKGAPWDYFHGNSLDPPTTADPTVLVSSRNTSSVYGVDPRSGHIRWVFGGRRDQFGLARHPAWFFCAQHDVHRLPDGDITIFDNGGADMHGRPHCPEHPAQALEFRLDVAHHTVRLVHRWTSRPVSKDGRGFFSSYVGSNRALLGGGAVVDWGQIPRVSVFGPSGREDGLLRLQFWSYRAFPARWVGRPVGSPAIAAQRYGDRLDAWVSWNGATQIRRWQLLGGATPGALAPIGAAVPFADLETHMAERSSAAYVAVRALGDGSVALGQSPAERPGASR